MIVHEGNEWILKSKDGKKTLGRHKTKEEAEAQERAVQASNHADGTEVVPGRLSRFDIFDAASLRSPQRLDNGFLKLDGRISRTGIQVYRDGLGNERRELRLPEEVFKKESIASFAMMPVTNTHPARLLTAQDAKQHSVGSVGEGLRQDGDFLAAPMILIDADAIAALEAGRSQLSCGYDCELEEKPGVWNGDRYDAIQRNIVGNHVALVDIARAGPEARVRLDANDAAMLAFLHTTNLDAEKKMPQTIRIDGISMEVTDGNAPAIQKMIDESVVRAKKDAEALAASEKSRADAADKAKKDLEAARDTLQAKVDAAAAKAKADKEKMVECDECGGTGKVDGKKCDGCDGEGEYPAEEGEEGENEDAKKDKKAKGDKKRADSRDRIVARTVNQRLALILQASKHLDSDAKVAEMAPSEIKKAVVVKVDGIDAKELEGKSDAYVDARFDLAIKKADQAPNGTDLARAAALTPPATGTRADGLKPTNHIDARNAYIERQRNAYKRNAK